MSGISGCINLKNHINIKKFHRMTNIIKHRGPDDEGYYFYSQNSEKNAYGTDSLKQAIKHNSINIKDIYKEDFIVGLGYRGLKINEPFVDYHQPMTFNDVTIVFDGRIYNYEQIKKQLEGQGHDFFTSSDAEVIIKSYIQWGDKCVEYLNGDWAFVIWDKKNKRLFCSRDRLGVKPLYYFFDGDLFIFSSEIKQIIEYGIRPKVNEKILFTFLFYKMDNISKETFFEDIYSLEGGENIILSVDDDFMTLSMKKYRYWNIENSKVQAIDKFEVESEEIGVTLIESIKQRLDSDVQVGSCLSGGIDSSSIVTLACEYLKQ